MQNKIDLMIIGAQKAGTTSLNYYLSQHPEIFTHYTQEFGLFADVKSYEKGFNYYFKNAVSDKDKSDANKEKFVAKHVGVMYNKELLIKLKEHNPEVKVAVILRNPVDRAFSAFWYCKKMGIEPYENFEQAVYKNDPQRFSSEKFRNSCDYIGRSKYADYLKDVFSVFDERNIKLLLFEEMILNFNEHLNELSKMAGVAEYFNFDTEIRYNERREIKSSFLNKLLRPGKNKVLKQVMPFKLRRILMPKLRQSISTSVNVNNEKKRMTPEMRTYLTTILKDEAEKLHTTYSLPVKKYWSDFR